MLRSESRWLTWHPETGRYDDGSPRVDKVPDGKFKAPAYWRSFETVCNAGWRDGGGVGFIFPGRLQTPHGYLHALDIDACIDPNTGVIAPWAVEVIERCGRSYTEVTPSGKGLRTWVFVRRDPMAWNTQKFHPPGVSKGIGKQAEVQFFGCEETQYVTVTGQRIDGTSEDVLTIDNLDWIAELFGVAPEDGSKGKAMKELPIGEGEKPTVDEVEAGVKRYVHGQKLIDCEWQDIVRSPGEAGTNGSAPPVTNSQAFFRLVALALDCARGWGEPVVKFLLTRTRWGLGKEGLDEKYGTESWVVEDVKRVAGKTERKRPPGDTTMFQPLGEDEGGVVTGGSKAVAPVFRMRSWQDAMQDPPVRWLIDDLIPRGGMVVLAGQPSAGKTVLVLDAALRMAHGLDWMGKPVKAASTLYLAGEGGGGLGARLRAWNALHGAPRPLGGEYVALVDGIPNLAAEGALGVLLALIAQAERDYGKVPDVIVVDTLAMATPGASENESAELGMVIRVLAEVRMRLGCTFVVLHHLRKAPPGGQTWSLDALRGSSALPAAADVVLLACVEGKTKTLRTAKSRDGEFAEPMTFRIHKQFTGVQREDGKMESGPAAVFEPTVPPPVEPTEDERAVEAEQRVLAALVEMGSSRRVDAVVRKARLKLTVGRDAFDRLVNSRCILAEKENGKINFRASTDVPPRPPTRDADVGRRGPAENGDTRPGTSGTSRDVEGRFDVSGLLE